MTPGPDGLLDLRGAIAGAGHCFLRAGQMRPLLEAWGALADWPAFAASWADLVPDAYLAEASRFRLRRYAVFSCDRDGPIVREPHQPHFQSHDYNVLFGGVERWFEPLREAVAGSQSLRTVLEFCRGLFAPLAPAVARWHVEVHQFRIEARADRAGEPTPEGVHRDGVDYVLVLLVQRRNIASGTTTIHAPDGAPLGSFTLTDPFDAALLDDARVHHGVTPVTPIDAGTPAYRDVLVVTWRGSIRALSRTAHHERVKSVGPE